MLLLLAVQTVQVSTQQVAASKSRQPVNDAASEVSLHYTVWTVDTVWLREFKSLTLITS